MNKFLKYQYVKNINKFIDIAVPIIDLLSPIMYSPNQKYNNRYFLSCLIDFSINNVSWNRYKGSIDYPIDGKYLNQIHNKYVNKGIYKEINKQFLNFYLKTGKETKLKYQCIDSTFIPNKGGHIKNNNYLLSETAKQKNKNIRKQNKKLPKNKRKKEESFIDFNRYNGRKKYLKISTITDSYGIPLTSTIISSKCSDNDTLINTIKNMTVNLNTLRNSKINRYTQYLLADAGYCSKRNRHFLRKIGYKPIIRFNKRNHKNKKKIKKNKLKGKELQIYKKRNIIESFFSWIKNYPVINQNYQKTVKSYYGLVLLTSSIIISKKI